MTFEVLPVVHVSDGAFPEYPGAQPERVLTGLARRFGRVVLVDVGGVRANDADLAFLQAASRKRSIWVDAGSRYATDAMDLIVAGAEAATLRWNTLDSVAELGEAAELAQPGSLFLGLEFPRGQFLANPRDPRSASEVAALAEALGIGLVFMLAAADADVARELPAAAVPRYVQGASRALATRLPEMGFTGALLAPAELPPEEAA